MKTETKIVRLMEQNDNNTIEIALCCNEQNIDNFILAYYKVIMHNLKLLKEKKERRKR